MWSLGATLFTAVEGRSRYARDTAMATLTALATDPPDTPRRAGPLRPVLLGLLRRNPRHRMRAPEAEKLLRRIAAGEGGRGLGERRGGLRSRLAASAAPIDMPPASQGVALAPAEPAAGA